MEEEKKVEIINPMDYKNLTMKVVECANDQGQLTAVLTQLQDAYSSLFATHEKVSKDYSTIAKENERLLKYNLELFMEHGERVAERNKNESGVESREKTRAETIKCEDLFKEEK